MADPAPSEAIPFTPEFSENHPYPSHADGTMIFPRPMAQLFFPDALTTVNFINAALDEVYGIPLSVAGLRSFGKAPIGRASEYDASVIVVPDSEEVRMTIWDPISRTPEAHAKFRSFVMDTIEVILGETNSALQDNC